MGVAKEGEGPVILEIFQGERLSMVICELELGNWFGRRQQGAQAELRRFGSAAGGNIGIIRQSDDGPRCRFDFFIGGYYPIEAAIGVGMFFE